MMTVEQETRRDLRKLSNNELEDYLHLAPQESAGRKIALLELRRRRLKSKSWTWKFLTIAVALIFLALTVVFLFRSQ